MSKSNQDNKWSGSNEVPSEACRFVSDNAIKFADGSGDKKMVKLIGYRGDIINHWYWGKLALDMDGLHFFKEKTPGLIDHDTNRRFTFSQEKETMPETYIAGPILDNPNAQEIAHDMELDFPFQASMYVEPEIVEQVNDGQSVEVNGRMLDGPGAVFRKAGIYEISAVVFGAFSNTESTAYNDSKSKIKFELISQKETEMAKEQKDENVLTLEKFMAEHKELHSQVLEAGAKSEIERFERIRKACGDDAELIVKCFAENLDTAEAQAAKIAKLSAENTTMAEKLAQKQNQSPEQRPDPAISEFNNQPAQENQPVVKFNEAEATDEQFTEHFNSSPELKKEFGDEVKDYISFVKADRKGLVKILNK